MHKNREGKWLKDKMLERVGKAHARMAHRKKDN